MADTALVSIAKVVKPHGLKGELSVIYYADAPFLLDMVPFVLLRRENGKGRFKRPHRFRVASWRQHRERFLITLEGLDGRDKAEEWSGSDMLVRERDLPPVEDGELLLHQLLDLAVYLAEGEGEEAEYGEYLGVIEDILTPQPEQEVWVIRTEDGREVLFPAHDETVLEVDMDEGRALVDPPPGLLDIYLNSE